MKRIITILVLSLVSPCVWAASRTASVDGLWTATATWGGLAEPTSADDVTINSGIEVICDSAPCIAFNATVNGMLVMRPGDDLTLGDGSATAGVGNLTIATTGAVIGGSGSTLTRNCDRTGESASICVTTNNGRFVWSGDVVRENGVVTGIAESGSYPDRLITITDSTLVQSAAGQYSGKYLIPQTGYFRGHAFPITTGGTVRDLVLRVDDRGARDTRNIANHVAPQIWTPGDWGPTVYRANASADGAVVSAGTTVTFSAGIFGSTAIATEFLLGSRFACENDLDVAADTDVGRFCSVTSATVATLCATYAGAACTGAADDGFFVFDDNQPPYAIVIREEFREGDTYIIIDPAMQTITDTAGNVSTNDDSYNIILSDGSTTDLRHSLIDYCGQDRDGGSATQGPSCILVTTIDNSLTTEQFQIGNTDIWRFNGEAAVALSSPRNMVIERVSIHDAQEGGENDGHEAHGIFATSSGSGAARNGNLTIRHNRVRGANDALIVPGNSDGSDSDLVVCDGCFIHDNWLGFSPANANSASIGAIEPAGGDMIGRSYGRRNFITNINDRGIWDNSGGSSSTVVSTTSYDHNVILNTQVISPALLSFWNTSTGTIDTLNKRSFTANIVIGFRNVGLERGHSWSNYFNPMNVFDTSSAAMLSPQSARGNIIFGSRSAVNNVGDGFLSVPTSDAFAALLPGTVSIVDNAYVGHSTHGPSGTQVAFKPNANAVPSADVTWSIQHNTFFCNESTTTVNNVEAVNTAPAPGMNIVVKNNVAFDCSKFINEPAAGAGGDTVSSYNLRLFIPNADTNVTAAGNDLTTGTVAFGGLYRGDLASQQGSTPWSSLGDDGTIRGVRVAGPPSIDSYLTIYPFLYAMVDTFGNTIPIPVNTNVINDQDGDGDGVWDSHDNCDITFNPNQYDPDGDGKGCVCDQGETCS